MNVNASFNLTDHLLAPPALLTKAMIRQRYLPTSGRTLDRWISSGAFPRPDIRKGGKIRFWRRETVENWINAQTEGGGQ